MAKRSLFEKDPLAYLLFEFRMAREMGRIESVFGSIPSFKDETKILLSALEGKSSARVFGSGDIAQ